MSIKRVNSTGRKKILREDARVFVRPDQDGVLTFDVALALAEYELPDDAKVFVEAHRQTTFMRFPYGTVAAPRSHSDTPSRLTEFGSPEGLLFCVKVTSIGERPGVLLAEADGIPASDDQEQPDHRLALLPPAPGDLGDEMWRIDLDCQGGPLLLINNRLSDWKEVAGSTVFRSLVYPAAMRQVLTKVVIHDELDDADDAESWQSRWLLFARALGAGDPPPQDADEAQKAGWIEEAVEAFARRHQFLNQFRSRLEEDARL